MSAEQFEVENADPLRFVVTESQHKHRYQFHVAEKDGHKFLSHNDYYILFDEPNAAKSAKFYANAAFEFAEAKARSMGLIK
jgi:hypothetical protein